jgi:hypothetical protein
MYPMVQMLQNYYRMNGNDLQHYRLIYDGVQPLFCVHALSKFQAQGTILNS